MTTPTNTPPGWNGPSDTDAATPNPTVPHAPTGGDVPTPNPPTTTHATHDVTKQTPPNGMPPGAPRKEAEPAKGAKAMRKKRYGHLDRAFRRPPMKEALSHFIANLGISPASMDHVIGLAGSVAGEGVTTTAMYLAQHLADTFGASVLVVETNFRAPKLAQYAKLDKGPGLLQILKQETDKAPLRASGHEKVAMLPAGGTEDNALGLLTSDRFAKFLAMARERYSIVILDIPPVLAYAEAAAMLKCADLSALVVASNRTSEKAVVKAVDRLEEKGVLLTGTLMNLVR